MNLHIRKSLRMWLPVLVSMVLNSAMLWAQPDVGKAQFVLATTWPVFALTETLASGTGIQVDLLTPAELGCPHHHSLTPGDLQKLTRAKLILAVGCGFEPFMPRLAKAMPNIPILEVASGLQQISGNPHLFSSPEGMRQLGESVASVLEEKFPEHHRQIASNAAFFSLSLVQSSEKWNEAKSKIGLFPIVITHDSLDYVTRDLGLIIAARLEEAEGEGLSISRLLSVKKTIEEKKVRAILVDSQHSSKAAETLSRETGVQVIVIDTMTTGPRDSGPSIPDRFRQTADQILAVAGAR